jgi:hypothetical protein
MRIRLGSHLFPPSATVEYVAHRLFRPLVDAREICLPIALVSLANGCHPECGRRSARLTTVRYAPPSRIAARLRATCARRRLSTRSW